MRGAPGRREGQDHLDHWAGQVGGGGPGSARGGVGAGQRRQRGVCERALRGGRARAEGGVEQPLGVVALAATLLVRQGERWRGSPDLAPWLVRRTGLAMAAPEFGRLPLFTPLLRPFLSLRRRGHRRLSAGGSALPGPRGHRRERT